MVVSIYTEIVAYEEVGGDMVTRLKDMGVHDVFEDIDKYYQEDYNLFNKALLFILHAYSLNSKFHVMGQSWIDTKERIAAKVGINHDAPFVNRPKADVDDDADEVEKMEKVLLYSDLVYMESKEVINCIQKYLAYQGNKNFRHLCMLKDQYVQMVAGALDPIVKSSGEIDYDQKSRNRKYATEILEEIQTWEQKVADSDRNLKDALIEFNRKKGVDQSLRLEDNLKTAASE